MVGFVASFFIQWKNSLKKKNAIRQTSVALKIGYDFLNKADVHGQR